MLFQAAAQDSLPGMSFKQLVRQGNKDFKNGYFYDAIRYFDEALKRDSTASEVVLQNGMAHFKIRDYKEALRHFENAAIADENCMGNGLYYYALTQKILGNSNKAIELFNKFIACYKGSDKLLKEWVVADIMGCYDIKSTEDTFVVQPLPAYINSGYSDLSPTLWKNKLFFASIHSDTLVFSKPDTGYKQPFMQLYFSETKDGEWTKPKHFSALNLANKHISNVSFSEDGNRMFFTLCNGELQQNSCAIWSADFEDGEWKNTFELNEKINYPGFSSTHPHLTSLENGKEILWFSSNQPGGLGGFDIWYSEREKGGKFQKAKNAGKIINTSRDEVTPFFEKKTGTLFFSSSGLIGKGGLDVFYARFGEGKFSLPKTLPAPLNSSYDESFYRLTERQKGYFTSNRPGVSSIKSETCCDDIFSFEIKKSIRPWLKVSAVDSNGNFILYTKITIADEAGNVLEEKEKQTLFFQLPANGKYVINATKNGYFNLQNDVYIDAYSSSDTNEIALMMKAVEVNKAFRIADIYFDYNSALLNEDSREALDTLFSLLQQNPKLKIEIGSHTDARGDDDFNLKLSQQRAESVVSYLVEKGIDRTRLSAKGYGKTMLLQDCTSDPDCGIYDCDCHRLNRRTEFIILGG